MLFSVTLFRASYLPKEGMDFMIEILKLKNISYEILDSILLENIHASVQRGDVIGIIGKNGAGKSTLLHMIAGELQPTKGQCIWLQQNVETSIVEQETQYFSTLDVSAHEATLLSKWKVPSSNFSVLSGGEKLKTRLAKGFSKNAQLLLLDEPTNHLDEESTKLLIEQIKQYKGSVILISHDRYFLDQVTTKIWSIENKKLYEHKGNYTSYMKAREQRRLTQQREFEKQQKMVERIETQIAELSSWSQKAHSQSTKQEGFKEYHRVKAKRTDSQVKSKKKRLEKELKKANVDQVEPDYEVQFTLQANEKRGRRFLEVKNLNKKYHERTLFNNVNFTIQHGEKVALMGANGSGKTTLLKIIMGLEAAVGNVWISPTAKIGYLTQDVFDLPLTKTPEELFHKETYKERGKIQNLMKHLGFLDSAWKEPIQNMSMGERVKCKLMVYIMEEKDVLILDEPTNHLDLPSREQLEKTLSSYNGTLLVVSHDYYFLEKITDIKLVIKDQGISRQLKNESPKEKEEQEELLLKLETERQEILGKISFMTPKDPQYSELDLRFNEVTKQIIELKKN